MKEGELAAHTFVFFCSCSQQEPLEESIFLLRECIAPGENT